MYDPYPTSAQPAEPGPPQPPRTVRYAAWFMYAGAVLSAISGVATALIARSGTAGAASHTHLTQRQLHAVAAGGVVIAIVYSLVVIALWLVLAWAARQGRSWARVTGSVLFAIDTVLLLLNLVVRVRTAAGGGGLASVPALLVWLAGLGAVTLLWRRESSAYFTGGGRG